MLTKSAIASLIVSIAAIGLYYWGFNTRAGQLYFDEMAGMIPLFSGVAGAIGLIGSVILFYFARR